VTDDGDGDGVGENRQRPRYGVGVLVGVADVEESSAVARFGATVGPVTPRA